MQIRNLGPADAAAFQALRLRGLLECLTFFASSYEEEYRDDIEIVAERLMVCRDNKLRQGIE